MNAPARNDPSSSALFGLAAAFDELDQWFPDGEVSMISGACMPDDWGFTGVSDCVASYFHFWCEVRQRVTAGDRMIMPESEWLDMGFASLFQRGRWLAHRFVWPQMTDEDYGAGLYSLTMWAEENPGVWGNRFGALMFESETAWIGGWHAHPLTLDQIAGHWRNAAMRQRRLENGLSRQAWIADFGKTLAPIPRARVIRRRKR